MTQFTWAGVLFEKDRIVVPVITLVLDYVVRNPLRFGGLVNGVGFALYAI